MRRIIIISVLFIIAISFISCNNSPQNNKEENDTESISFREACKDGNFDIARDTLNVYYINYMKEARQWNGNNRKLAEAIYYEAFDYIYKQETMYILTNLEGKECTDRITFLMEDIPVIGDKYPEGLCSYFVSLRGEHDDGFRLDMYVKWTEHFNNLCNTVLNLSINRKNKELAQTILTRFVENVEVTPGSSGSEVVIDGQRVDGNHGYIKYTKKDIDIAKKKYDEAVKSGAFN